MLLVMYNFITRPVNLNCNFISLIIKHSMVSLNLLHIIHDGIKILEWRSERQNESNVCVCVCVCVCEVIVEAFSLYFCQVMVKAALQHEMK